MKNSPWLVLKSALCSVAGLSCGTLMADPSAHQAPGMAPQPLPAFYGGGVNKPSLIEWQGVPQRTYLLQWSADAVNWNYFPLTEEGAGEKSFGTFSSTPRLFTRLHYSDETPDMATDTNWQPPLLRVAGMWKVQLTHASGDTAVGVPLSFYRWNVGEAAPQSTPMLLTYSGADGSYTLNPQAFTPPLVAGDRVEVRLSGSPNQRVYLPWQPGSAAGDANIAPGGNGLAVADVIPDPAVGTSPDADNAPPELIEEPVYRFADFLTARSSVGTVQKLQYPVIAQKELVEEITTPWGKSPPRSRNSADDEEGWHSWNWFCYLGSAWKNGVSGVPDYFTDYALDLSLAFADISLKRPVQRNVMVIPQRWWVGAPEKIPLIYPVQAGGNPPFEFKDGALCQLGSAQFPYFPLDTDLDDEEHQYSRHLVLGPVPMHVPKSVMGGKPFFFNKLSDVKLCAELPFWGQYESTVVDEFTNTIFTYPVKIVWTATIVGTNDLSVTIKDGLATSPQGTTSTLPSNNEFPKVLLEFAKTNPEAPEFDEGFSVIVSAKARVITAPWFLQQTDYDLGSFTTDFQFTDITNNSSSQRFAIRQAAELRGLGGANPEGDSLLGGQRSKTLEPERKIGVNGQPAPGAATFVDALTGRFHHSETDFALPVPGSDLVLAVSRSSTDSIWSEAFGLRPEEHPLLPFGPGWDSNLCASLLRVVSLNPAGAESTAPNEDPRRLVSTVTVRDYQGRAYSFFEYTNGDDQTTFLPDPTQLPERATTSITLSRAGNGEYTLTQPLLGITHVYSPTTANFRVPNNRDTAFDGANHPSGFTSNHYHRLTKVTDRFGVSLLYEYANGPASLLPQQISVEGRTDLRLRFRQEDGRIQSFWDPAGIKHSYLHEIRNLAANGQPAALHPVLASHHIGPRLDASYGYHYAIEADPRPEEMLAPLTSGSGLYRIATQHITPQTISRGNSETLTIHYQPSQTRSCWSSAASAYYHPAGDPLLVDAITLPNATEVDYDPDHTLKFGRPAREATDTEAAVEAIPSDLTITTEVTDFHGSHWTYEFATPTNYRWELPSADAAHLPSAAALFFPSLTRRCDDVADTAITFDYDARAGFALTESTDAADRSTRATFELPHNPTNNLYSRPLVAGAVPMHSFYPLPSTSTNLLGQTTTYHYNSAANPLLQLLPETITDSRDRTISISRDALARQTSLTLHDAENVLLSQIDYAYTNATFPGALTRVTRKALSQPQDPAWVSDLVTDFQFDALGFPALVGNDAANLNQQVTRSASGRILEATTPAGGTRSLTYDDAGLLSSTSLADGSTYHFQYDDAARLVISRDPLGNATGLEYDSLGRVTTSVRDMNGDLSYSSATGLTGIQPATDIVTATEYLDATRALRLTDPRGFISEQQFDPLGRLTTLIQPAAERAPGTIPTVATDRVTRWEYDLLASPSQPVKITDPLGYATHFLFDDFARLETILREYASDGQTKLHAKLQYAFSPITGLTESVTTFRSPFDENNAALDLSAAQLTQAVIYDTLDRPQQQVFAAGSDKELITKQSYTSTGIPFLKEIRESTDPLASWSAYRIECDALGRPTKQILPAVVDARTDISAHPSTEIHYDAYGRISSTSDAYGHSTEFGYDILGRLAYEKLPAVTDAHSQQISRPTTLYHYDPRGLLSKRIDPRGYAWHSDYDAAGRLTSRSGPVLRPELPDSQRRPLWQYFYDTASNLTETIDPRGHSTHSSYFPDNRLDTSTQDVTLTDANGTPTITPVSHRYQYDALGRLTRLSDGLNQATTFGYDGLGRTISTTRDADDAARKKTETTEYDALLSTAHIDAANRRKEFFYDDQFRLEQLSIIGHSEENLSFDYDLRGRLTGIQPITPPADLSLGNPAISRSYDPLGRLTSETSNTVTSQYGYDLLSQITRITDSASATTTHHSYDPAGRRSSTTTSPLITGQSALTTSFGYNLAGQLVRETLPNGLEQSNTLDPAGRITAQTLRAAGSTQSISRTEYEYDLLANVTLLRETFAPGLNIPSRTLSNSYDQRSQLISEQQQESGGQLGTTTRTRSEIHRYDAAENRLSTVREINDPQNGASTLQRSFTFGNATNGYNSNQLYQLTETLDAGAPLTSTFGYDPNGNRSSKATASLTDTYTYDSFNRLTGLELNTAAPSENGNYQYRYDPLIRRIARSTGAAPSAANTYQFAFSGSSPVHEWDGDISSTSYHQQRTGSGVGGLLQTQEADGTATHPRHNLRGDITAQFSETGTLLWHGSYASNGMLNHQYGTREGKYGANGKYEEPAGLINEGFRYRDRLTNTFITRDPAGFIDGPNDYNYVRHNPWSAWDPNGLATVLIPQTTGDIGYVSPDAFKSTVVPSAMDANSLSNQTTPISQNGYQGGAGSSQTLPDYMTFPAMEYWDLLSAIVEANAEPISWTMFHLPESSEIEKQKWLNSPKARVLDLIKGGIDLPGHIGAGVFNFVFQTDITSVPLEFRGWGRSIGFGEERPTGERIFWLALSAIPEAKLAGSSLVRSAEREVAIAARGIGSIERSGVSISSGSTLTNSQIDLTILGSSAAKNLPNPYAGIQDASAFLKSQGVSRADRVQILQSFNPQNITVRQAGSSEFGLRYFSDATRPSGSYLFETFPASRSSLAIKPEWSTMSGFKQFQVRPGATILEGSTGPQGPYLPGGQTQKFIFDWRNNLLEP